MRNLKVLIILFLIPYLYEGTAKAEVTFGELVPFGPPVNKGTTEYSASISADGLELYYDAWQNGQTDIWTATRLSIDEDWGESEKMGISVNSSSMDWTPRISADGLELYFSSSRIGSLYSGFQIYVARRQSITGVWQQAENLGEMINSSYEQTIGGISANGLELYHSSDNKMYVATRVTKNSPWIEKKAIAPTILGEYPSISPNGSHLFFSSSSLPGGMGDSDIWMMTRASFDTDWSAPVNLGPVVNSQITEHRPWISHDGSTLLFTSGRVGGDVVKVEVIPPLSKPAIDLNGDGIIDSADICILVDNWQTNNKLCDIAPPLGDGIVDIQDLIFLSEHLFEKVDDPTLAVHWALDETEGIFALDSISGNNDFVMGNPLWHPGGGIVEGALELDGIDDCIISSAGLNPAMGPFSVVAWIKGGAPGQVIISRPSGSDWLAINAEGKLMTDLKVSGEEAVPLLSQTLLADEQWHRIGLVWDGSRRMLYVDGVMVAEDKQDELNPFGGGLYIGVGKNFTPDTFFSGLIDDVRIYKRILTP